MDHKRGATFDYAWPVPADFADGYFADFVPTCQIRGGGNPLLAQVTCAWADPATTRLLTLFVPASETRLWKLGKYLMDIDLTRTSDGYVQSTSTIEVNVIQDITQPTV
jgi:hypothetical protein